MVKELANNTIYNGEKGWEFSKFFYQRSICNINKYTFLKNYALAWSIEAI